MFTAAERVRILSEALPYIQRFSGKLIVIKYGGAAMGDATLKCAVARDLVLLKHVGMHPIIVHGGGPAISKTLAERGVQSQFYQGYRVTDHATMNIVAETLATINQDLARAVVDAGGTAVTRPHGAAAAYIRAQKLHLDDPDAPDLGWAGQVSGIEHELVSAAQQKDIIPVLSPVGVDNTGQRYNINADLVAAHVAVHLRAEKLIMMTNARGVLDADGQLLPEMSKSDVTDLISTAVITDGMVPKLKCALEAVDGGVNKAHIIDGRVQNAVLLELLTDEGVGTLIKSE